MPSYDEIVKDVAETLVRAGSCFGSDQIEVYEKAIASETNPSAAWALRTILDNANVGKVNRLPLCDDTGIPHLFLQVGDEVSIPEGFFSAVEEGVRQGLRSLPGRPMAVKGNDQERLAQSAGLYSDPACLAAAPVQIRHVSGHSIKLTVLMYGGGPEIRGKTLRVFHQHSAEVVKKEMIDWGIEGAKLLGCLPGVLCFGIGRSNLEAASLSLEAMATGDLSTLDPFEQEITDGVNASGIGAMGLGGNHTVLGSFVKVGPQRASGVRIVSLRVGCCFDPRRASVTWTN